MVSAAFIHAVRSMWSGIATVTVQEGVLNPANGRTEPQERTLAAGVPCRISYKTIQSTQPREEAAQVTQRTVLYVGPSVEIPEGSKITVTQNGMTQSYAQSGKAAVYSTHKEVPLELFGGWA